MRSAHAGAKRRRGTVPARPVSPDDPSLPSAILDPSCRAGSPHLMALRAAAQAPPRLLQPLPVAGHPQTRSQIRSDRHRSPRWTQWLVMKSDSHGDLDGENHGDEPVDGGAERRPPPCAGNVVAALLPEVLETMACVAKDEE